MKRFHLRSLPPDERQRLLNRYAAGDSRIADDVRAIVAAVAEGGDEALRSLTKTFDGVLPDSLVVPESERNRAAGLVFPEVRTAVQAAARNISTFHLAEFPEVVETETQPGVTCRREWRPIDTVGLYIPGGTAPLFSTVLMLAIPATIAGCRRIIICTPPRRDGSIAPEILFAADTCGVKEIYRIGGAQAIAAMAIGTATVRKADKIFGPGNRYVTAAKNLVTLPPYSTAIDLTAGPTELLIIADRTADPATVAADLIAQAEHGADTRVILISLSEELGDEVLRCLAEIAERQERREFIARSLDQSAVLDAESMEEAISFSNCYAPEHLQLAVGNPSRYAGDVRSAGSVFLGTTSSAVFGDYASGTNHTLPTMGAARAAGGVTVESFMKPVTFQWMTPEGASDLASTVASLAKAEGLNAHAGAALARRLARD